MSNLHVDLRLFIAVEGVVKGFVKRLVFLGPFYLSSRCVNLDASLEKIHVGLHGVFVYSSC